jgi:cytoskeletal protein CcmA (bactofilin family)
MKYEIKQSDEILGFLDEGTSVSGELHFSGTLHIDGNFTGSICSDDTLIVGKHAVVRADIKVGEIQIAGEVLGNIEAKQRTEIFESGRVQGDIHSPILVMSPGSMLNGRICMPGEIFEEPTATSTDPP